MCRVRLSVLFLVMYFGVVLAGELEGDKVLIQGPEVNLTVEDLRRALLSVPRKNRELAIKDPVKIREVMDSTYMTKVAATRALKKRLDKDPETAALIWNRTQNFLAFAELDDAMNQAIGPDADYEQAAYERYLANRDDYRLSERFKASHILLQPKEGESDEELRERAEKLYRELSGDKIDFESAAREYSADKGSAEKGGSLGTFRPGQMVKPFREALQALEPGQISQPVKTRFGYHIIRLEERIPASYRPFEEVKAELIEKAKDRARLDFRRDYWRRVREDPNARVNEKAFEAFIADPVLVPERKQ